MLGATLGFLLFGLAIAALIYDVYHGNQRKEKQKAESSARFVQLAAERRERQEQLEQERKRQEQERKRQREEALHKRKLHQQQRQQERDRQIEALLNRDALRDRLDYMSGVEFEHFMADVFKKKGYIAKATRASGDQGVDLLLEIDERKIAVQLKRYTAPVGNAAVREVFAGMIHYRAQEAWVITTSSFTKSAVELAKSTGVRLIARNELENWLSDLRDEV